MELSFGHTSLPFYYDEGRYRVLEAGERNEPPLSDAGIGEAIDAPIDSPALEDLLTPGESVLVVVSDATRATASAQVVNILVRRVVAAGIAPRDLRIIFATGIHRAVTQAEKRELLTPFVLQRIGTLNHHAGDSSSHVSVGTTASGTLAELNRALVEHSRVILTGAIGFHYFAGFTGGRKSVCPGLASARTIEATHMLALDFEKGGRRAGVGTGKLDGNAVHEECERIAALVAPSFLVNTIVDEHGRAVRVYAGHWHAAHRRACADYTKAHSVVIDRTRGVVIASCGGAPYDINLIQAHKTLDMAAHACREGGTIILLAECSDGLGRSDFLKWFTEKDSRSLESRLRTHYEVNGQTAWSLWTKAGRFRVRLISTLPDEDVRAMRMTPAHSLEEALAGIDPGEEGYILPRGASLLPVLETGTVTTAAPARADNSVT